jgi:dCTP deaminase
MNEEKHGILSGNAILEAVKAGRIRIDPFDPKQLNPVSIDLTLGSEVRVYQEAVLDSRQKNPTKSFTIGPDGLVIYPGTGYLMHTIERVWTDSYVPIIDGKSSLGRLFVKVHETAGYGDPHFNGQYTLEVTCVHPIRLYAGMRVCQVRFNTIVGEVTPYDGHYKGETAMGAVASRSWEQFD